MGLIPFIGGVLSHIMVANEQLAHNLFRHDYDVAISALKFRHFKLIDKFLQFLSHSGRVKQSASGMARNYGL
jgi:hypothetical protein